VDKYRLVASFYIDQCHSRIYLLDHPEVKVGRVICEVSDLCGSKSLIAGSVLTLHITRMMAECACCNQLYYHDARYPISHELDDDTSSWVAAEDILALQLSVLPRF
jgi:hypothetical protein